MMNLKIKKGNEMTNKEAIEILLTGSADMQNKKHSWNEIMDAIKIAVFELKRSIPEEVRSRTKHVDHVKGYCPSCGYCIKNYGDIEFCFKCGKKLDWTDHE